MAYDCNTVLMSYYFFVRAVADKILFKVCIVAFMHFSSFKEVSIHSFRIVLYHGWSITRLDESCCL